MTQDGTLQKVDNVLQPGKKATLAKDGTLQKVDNMLQPAKKATPAKDGALQKVDNVLQPGKKATPAKRKMRDIKTIEKKSEKKCSYKTYNMYLKGGRNGKGKKLHNEGFE